MTVIGLDIGGANLKAAHSDGVSCLRPFALWKRPGDLTCELGTLVKSLPGAEQWAVTMTGEMCDCFATKREGVRHILGAVAEVADPANVQVWRTDGRFGSIAESLVDPLPAAAANWLALATYAGRFAPTGAALLIDIGSTTTDIVPLMDGVPIPLGRTDIERLRSHELVYAGVRRTPVCALLEPGDGMAEFFATIHDVHLLLDWTVENETDFDTADGRPATRAFARARLARMLGGDAETISRDDVQRFAERVAENQMNVIIRGLRTVAAGLAMPTRCAIVTGSGHYLAQRAVQRSFDARPEIVEFPGSPEAACAVAVATLLNERP